MLVILMTPLRKTVRLWFPGLGFLSHEDNHESVLLNSSSPQPAVAGARGKRVALFSLQKIFESVNTEHEGRKVN